MIVTRGYRLSETPRLIEINELCYSGVQRPTPSEFNEMLSHRPFIAKVGHDLVSSIEGGIVGFAVCRQDTRSDGMNVYLWSLAVDPEYQGRGVGGNLLREVIKYYTLAKAEGISLHVHPDNPAQKLYFDYGFRVEAIARNWYRAEGNGLYMRRALP